MSPSCGYLSLFRSKRSVLVSLEGFRDRRRGPVRRLLAPVPSGPVPSGRRRPWTPGSGVPRVGRLLLGPQSLGLRCRPSCLASPSPVVPGRRFRVAGPCSRLPGRCSRAPGRCSRVARRHGRVPGSRPGAPDRQFGLGCRPGPRVRGPSGRPGPARTRTVRPAREYDSGVSEWEPVRAGARGKGADRLALYRRV
jgi:hypothetical protein